MTGELVEVPDDIRELTDIDRQLEALDAMVPEGTWAGFCKACYWMMVGENETEALEYLRSHWIAKPECREQVMGYGN